MKPASLAAVVPLMLAVAGVAQAQTACVYPQAPQTFPDGATAPKEDMVAGQQTVKGYASAVQDTYLPCLEKEKQDSIANMQLRLPVVVIGGGLTAIDTATESLAYYAVQVEKFLARFEALSKESGEDSIREAWDDYEREIAEEFLAHARAIREERAAATREKRAPRIAELLQHRVLLNYDGQAESIRVENLIDDGLKQLAEQAA